MPFCAGCGQEMSADAAFCAKCGAPTGAAGHVAPSGPAQVAATGLDENLAGLLCYVLGWVTGLVFLLIDKRPFVRFHAMQSLFTFGGLHILRIALMMVGFTAGFGGMMGGHFAWSLSWMILSLVNLAALVAWIICMVKAFQHQQYKLPVIGNMSENYAR